MSSTKHVDTKVNQTAGFSNTWPSPSDKEVGRFYFNLQITDPVVFLGTIQLFVRWTDRNGDLQQRQSQSLSILSKAKDEGMFQFYLEDTGGSGVPFFEYEVVATNTLHPAKFYLAVHIEGDIAGS